MTPHLRPATQDDIPALLEIERQSFSEPTWQAADFAKYSCLVAEIDGCVAGFLVVRETFSARPSARAEREILNVAVAERFRRLGIAAALLNRELHSGALYFLEVRESNSAAQALYRKLGFTAIAQRKEYYHNPPETAIVMRSK